MQGLFSSSLFYSSLSIFYFLTHHYTESCHQLESRIGPRVNEAD